MSKKNFKDTAILLINLFIPGSANIESGSYKAGSLLVIVSFILFFMSPYLPLIFLRLSFLILIIISYIILFKKRTEKKLILPARLIMVIVLLFVLMSVLSLNFAHQFSTENTDEGRQSLVYVLGTKPFKMESIQNMLDMSDEELLQLFSNDIHPFFRRLRMGILQLKKNYTSTLAISAGKNQKKVTQKILNSLDKEAVYFSCRTTKEEIIALKDYIEKRDPANIDITIVSDDYHAFRVLHYAKLKNLKNVSFYATVYEYSILSFFKRYLIEQVLFALSYITFPISLLGIVI